MAADITATTAGGGTSSPWIRATHDGGREYHDANRSSPVSDARLPPWTSPIYVSSTNDQPLRRPPPTSQLHLSEELAPAASLPSMLPSSSAASPAMESYVAAAKHFPTPAVVVHPGGPPSTSKGLWAAMPASLSEPLVGPAGFSAGASGMSTPRRPMPPLSGPWLPPFAQAAKAYHERDGDESLSDRPKATLRTSDQDRNLWRSLERFVEPVLPQDMPPGDNAAAFGSLLLPRGAPSSLEGYRQLHESEAPANMLPREFLVRAVFGASLAAASRAVDPDIVEGGVDRPASSSTTSGPYRTVVIRFTAGSLADFARCVEEELRLRSRWFVRMVGFRYCDFQGLEPWKVVPCVDESPAEGFDDERQPSSALGDAATNLDHGAASSESTGSSVLNRSRSGLAAQVFGGQAAAAVAARQLNPPPDLSFFDTLPSELSVDPIAGARRVTAHLTIQLHPVQYRAIIAAASSSSPAPSSRSPSRSKSGGGLLSDAEGEHCVIQRRCAVVAVSVVQLRQRLSPVAQINLLEASMREVPGSPGRPSGGAHGPPQVLCYTASIFFRDDISGNLVPLVDIAQLPDYASLYVNAATAGKMHWSQQQQSVTGMGVTVFSGGNRRSAGGSGLLHDGDNGEGVFNDVADHLPSTMHEYFEQLRAQPDPHDVARGLGGVRSFVTESTVVKVQPPAMPSLPWEAEAAQGGSANPLSPRLALPVGGGPKATTSLSNAAPVSSQPRLPSRFDVPRTILTPMVPSNLDDQLKSIAATPAHLVTARDDFRVAHAAARSELIADNAAELRREELLLAETSNADGSFAAAMTEAAALGGGGGAAAGRSGGSPQRLRDASEVAFGARYQPARRNLAMHQLTSLESRGRFTPAGGGGSASGPATSLVRSPASHHFSAERAIAVLAAGGVDPPPAPARGAVTVTQSPRDQRSTLIQIVCAMHLSLEGRAAAVFTTQSLVQSTAVIVEEFLLHYPIGVPVRFPLSTSDRRTLEGLVRKYVRAKLDAAAASRRAPFLESGEEALRAVRGQQSLAAPSGRHRVRADPPEASFWTVPNSSGSRSSSHQPGAITSSSPYPAPISGGDPTMMIAATASSVYQQAALRTPTLVLARPQFDEGQRRLAVYATTSLNLFDGKSAAVAVSAHGAAGGGSSPSSASEAPAPFRWFLLHGAAPKSVPAAAVFSSGGRSGAAGALRIVPLTAMIRLGLAHVSVVSYSPPVTLCLEIVLPPKRGETSSTIDQRGDAAAVSGLQAGISPGRATAAAIDPLQPGARYTVGVEVNADDASLCEAVSFVLPSWA